MTAVTRLIKANRLPHLLFYGPPGTGKTSTILAVAKQLYGESKYKAMTLELNASDDRGIGVVRNQIKEFAGTQKLFSKGVKLVILDEADAMTSDAQFALRRVIEKYTKNTRFCLICNYVSKIIPALQSRCTRFRFAPLRPSEIESRLRSVADTEGLKTTDAGVKAVLRLAKGDMRKVLNVLQSTAMAFDEVGEEEVYACTGDPTPKQMTGLMKSLLTEDFGPAVKHIQELQRVHGLALSDLITNLAVMTEAIKIPDAMRMLLMERMADVEYRLAAGGSEKLEAGALAGAWIEAKLVASADREAQKQEQGAGAASASGAASSSSSSAAASSGSGQAAMST